MKKLAKLPALAPADFRAWIERRGITQAAAAVALGLSRRQIERYVVEGAPRTVALACAALDCETTLRRSASTLDAREPAIGNMNDPHRALLARIVGEG